MSFATGLLKFSGLHFLHLSIRHGANVELWRAVGMVQQGATFRHVGVALGKHKIVITKD
jgi:hypothetical protein